MCAAELILSGCTTASDHLYIFPRGSTLDDEIHAVEAVGLRFHASRGSMSVGESLGGLPPDSLVERESDILRDSRQSHRNVSQSRAARDDPHRACALLSVLRLARSHARDGRVRRSYPGVRLHTHLAENKSDVDCSLATFGLLPGRLCRVRELVGR